MERRTYIFAGGGTGGHLFPGISVAAALQPLDAAAEIHFFCTPRDVDRQLLDKAGYARTAQCVLPWPNRPWRWPLFFVHWFQSLGVAKSFIRERRPVAVLGLGGYAAGPAVVAGHKLGVRTAILNPDAMPGRANRRLAARVELVAMQWDASRRHFATDRNCMALGCPIRDGFGPLDAGTARKHFELDPARPTLLVTGASQGARTVNQAVLASWPEFRRRYSDWQLLHLAGAADAQAVRAAYGGDSAVRVLDFTHEMPVALAAADLVVSRAGASTLAELTALGKPSILLPYPHIQDRHQHANGQVLVDAGAAIMMDDLCDAAMNRGPLLAALSSLAGDAKRRDAMSAAAKTLARPNAARDVARWMVDGRLP